MDPIIVHSARAVIGLLLIAMGVAVMARSWRSPLGTPLGTGFGAALTALGIKALFA